MSQACVWACSWVQVGPASGLFACKHRCRHRLGSMVLPSFAEGQSLWPVLAQTFAPVVCGVSVASCALERMLWPCATPGRDSINMGWEQGDHGTWREPAFEPALCLAVERLSMWIEYTRFIHFKWLFLLLRSHVHIWKLRPKFLGG